METLVVVLWGMFTLFLLFVCDWQSKRRREAEAANKTYEDRLKTYEKYLNEPPPQNSKVPRAIGLNSFKYFS